MATLSVFVAEVNPVTVARLTPRSFSRINFSATLPKVPSSNVNKIVFGSEL
jgi:hypothetical protein